MWKNLNINRNLIKAETGKAVLIAMPHSSDYDGYSFWHPAKLVRDSRRPDLVSIGYTGDFSFRLRKVKKGEVLDELTLAGDEMEEILKEYDPLREELPIIHTPTQLAPENAAADASLIDE